MAYSDYNNSNTMKTQVLFAIKNQNEWLSDETIYPLGYAMLGFAEKDDNEILTIRVGDGEHKYLDLPILNGIETSEFQDLGIAISKSEPDANGNIKISLSSTSGETSIKVPGEMTVEKTDIDYVIYMGGVPQFHIPYDSFSEDTELRSTLKSQYITITENDDNGCTLNINTSIIDI